MSGDPLRARTLEHLAQQLRRAGHAPSLGRSAASLRRDGEGLSTGIPPLDALLPDGGLRRGTLVEWLACGRGSGAATLALGSLAHLLRARGTLLVIDPAREFYPPAAAELGIDLRRTVLIRPPQPQLALWSLEQALGCSDVAAVVCWMEALEGRLFRRLQLAVEKSRGIGFLLRPEPLRRFPSWADVRLLVRPLGAGRAGTSAGRGGPEGARRV